MEYILKNALLLLAAKPNATLLDLPRLFTDDTFRRKLIKRTPDEYVKAFWEEEYEALDNKTKREYISPNQNKVGQFAIDPILRNVVGRKSKFDPLTLMERRKVLLCNFSRGMGEDPAHLLGAFVTAFYQAATLREKREDFTLYVDEFQNVATDTFDTILSEARKLRLNLVLCHEYLGQVSDRMRQSVIGNAGTLIVFRIGTEDAPLLARELGTDPQALTGISNFEAWVKRSQRPLGQDIPARAAHGLARRDPDPHRAPPPYARPRSA